MDFKNKIAEIITKTHRTPQEQADEILQLITDNSESLQLIQSCVVGQSEQFYCDGQENNKDRCESQCLGCAGMEEIHSQ
ncbi:hypothetical protein [Flavobacterium sp. WC2430]|uniref:hypothetical protein n=1 Tax=Flavobacterium sp. WC2430 TaxID=3234137 RepID=UPI003466F3CE